MLEQIQAAVCPYCGLVFIAASGHKSCVCPSCERRFTLRSAALLEAQLEHGEDDE